jgi:hypothetical protein
VQQNNPQQEQNQSDGYTQREWDRVVGIGEVPEEYKRKPRLTINDLERLYDRG